MSEIKSVVYLSKSLRKIWERKTMQELEDWLELMPLFEGLTPKEITIFWEKLFPFFDACNEYLPKKGESFLGFHPKFRDICYKIGLIEIEVDESDED